MPFGSSGAGLRALVDYPAPLGLASHDPTFHNVYGVTMGMDVYVVNSG